MAKGRGKHPVIGQQPSSAKRPGRRESVAEGKRPSRVVDIDETDVYGRSPVWRFANVDHDGPWSFAKIDSATLVGLLTKLCSFESMTLRELFAPGEKHGKRYQVAQMPAHARKRLTEIERDDLTDMVRLRCGGAPRLYGYLQEHVFHVLWWDPLHQVWPSTKKHT